MNKSKFARVQGQSRCTALVWNHATVRTAIVDRFATNGMPGLGQMDANLVRAAGFELADEHSMVRQFFQYLHMCHCVLAGSFRAAPTPSVATVSNEPR